MNTVNYSKSELERMQKEYLKQAMEMASRSSSDPSEETQIVKSDGKIDEAEAPEVSTSSDSVSGESSPDSGFSEADGSVSGEDNSEEEESPSSDNTENEAENKEEKNEDLFPAVSADISSDGAVKNAKEVIADISESVALLGKSDGEAVMSASEIPPPSFGDFIEKHNRRV